jgi:DNA-binding MarR family transcriptional regulator
MPDSVRTRPVAGLTEQAGTVEEASLALVEMTLAALAGVEGISSLQLRMLLLVDRHPQSNLSSVASRMDMSVPSASRLVDRLVEAGLLDRRDAPHSRREVALSLTARGNRALAELRRSRRQAIGVVLEAMADDQRRALVSGLTAFAAAAGIEPGR